MDETEDTAAEFLDWLAESNVVLTGLRGELAHEDARRLVQAFLDGSRRSTLFTDGVAPRLVLERVLGKYT